MNAERSRKRASVAQDEVPQSAAEVTPGFLGGGEHSFTLQAIMEMQKSVGEINANMTALRTSVDGMKSKVDDLVGWKNRILGGAAVLAVVIAGLGFVIGKGSEYVTLKMPSTSSPPPTPPTKPSS